MEHIARVHRFHDTVAIHVGDGQTVYLTPDQAAQLAAALEWCRDEIQAGVSFSASEFPTTDIA